MKYLWHTNICFPSYREVLVDSIKRLSKPEERRMATANSILSFYTSIVINRVNEDIVEFDNIPTGILYLVLGVIDDFVEISDNTDISIIGTVDLLDYTLLQVCHRICRFDFRGWFEETHSSIMNINAQNVDYHSWIMRHHIFDLWKPMVQIWSFIIHICIIITDSFLRITIHCRLQWIMDIDVNNRYGIYILLLYDVTDFVNILAPA